ncbi:MAG: hypothetical protein U5N85_00375 [Arcicella sp.]|nr:hypothetical protein [Arcicella sp.]
MKIIASIILTVTLFIACKSKESITPTSTNFIGKWNPTYITQTKNTDGSWTSFYTINTLVALPVYEFTNDGRFLRDGKDGADCCTSGSKYFVVDDVISFTERQICPTVKCISCDNWAIIEVDSENLILEECGRVRNKFVRGK